LESNRSFPGKNLNFNFNNSCGKEQQKHNSFPYKIINGAAKAFTEEYSYRLEVPAEFLYMSFLTCLGSSLADKITIHTEIKPQPRLYTLLLGESADTRKSTAITKTVDFFIFALKNIDSIQFRDCWGVGSAEGLAKYLKPNKHEPEGLNKNVQLCYDEFKSFISKAKIKSSTLLECVNSLFENNKYENHTNKSKIIIRNGFLSILAASTIQTYESTWDKAFTDIGFSNRIFIVPGSGKRKDVLPPAIPLTEMQNLVFELLSIIEFVGYKKVLSITDPAYQLLQNWYENRPSSLHSKRLDGYALRILILMAANLKIDTINVDLVENAIALVDWQLEMRQQYDPIDADNEMAKLEEKIRRSLVNKKELTERELKQCTNANRTGLWLFTTALSNLKNSNEIYIDKKSKKWRIM